MKIDEFINKYNLNLNEQQKEAVENINGKILLLAVPGSGKTTVIVSRIGYMIYCKNILPENILTLTYSVSATKDMKRKYSSIFGENNKLQFRTINSFCVSVIREFERQTGRTAFTLFRNTEEILSHLYIRLKNDFPNETVIKDINSQIIYANNMLLKDSQIREIKNDNIDFYKIYKEYENYKIKNKIMDFDDQLKYAYTILKSYKSIRQKFMNRYTYINVDEAQDTSKIQHEIIKLLVNKNIFMVGDEDQSIYKFRAAYPKALLDFEKVYEDSKVLYMETNYRSTPEILQIANNFIKQNVNRKDKNIIPYRASGQTVKITEIENYEDQYKYLLNILKDSNEQTAILYRNNESAIPIIDIFLKNNISFKIKEGETTFFNHKVVNDIKNFIKFYFESNNIKIFEEIYYKINCGISKNIMNKLKIKLNKLNNNANILDVLTTIDEVLFWQIRKINDIKLKMSLWRNKNTYEIINSILKELEYEEFIKRKKEEKNIYMQKINILLSIAKQNPDLKRFLIRLDELEEKIREGNKEDANIILSTIHSSKGLEYDNVILIDVIQGILPCIDKPDSKNIEKLDEYEEEVRLFYVGITRAKNVLKIFKYIKQFGNYVESSDFINEILNNNKTGEKQKYNNIYKLGDVINHKRFGKCKVIGLDNEFIIIKCKNGLKKKLNLAICMEKKIIS